jgi:hypothetical protein
MGHLPSSEILMDWITKNDGGGCSCIYLEDFILCRMEDTRTEGLPLWIDVFMFFCEVSC